MVRLVRRGRLEGTVVGREGWNKEVGVDRRSVGREKEREGRGCTELDKGEA